MVGRNASLTTIRQGMLDLQLDSSKTESFRADKSLTGEGGGILACLLARNLSSSQFLKTPPSPIRP